MNTESSRRNVYLIDPGTDSNLNLLPLGIGRIASYCRSLDKISNVFDCQVRWLRQPAADFADSLQNPVVVGLPCYVWNTQASLELARAIRARHPDCLIVVGGASIPKRDASIKTFLAENPCIDVLVRGDGEAMFLEVADQFYDKLGELTKCLLDAHKKELPSDLLAELFDYQRLRMTVWQPAATHHRDLCYDLPTYFDQLQQGNSVDMPTKKTCQIDVIVPANEAADKFDHARRGTLFEYTGRQDNLKGPAPRWIKSQQSLL